MLLTKVANGEEVAEEVGKLAQYMNDKIPQVIDFALSVVFALLVFVVGSKVIGWIRKLLRRSLERGGVDKGVEQFVDSFAKFALYAILIFSIGKNFGLDTTSVAAALASCGVAVGLALQGSLSNFAGGVLILVLKPFVVGDYIVEDNKGQEGTVKEIQLFYTKLSTADNKTVIIPNGTLANTSLTNVTAQNKRRVDVSVGISYDADLKKAKSLIENLLRSDEDILKDEDITVFVDSLGDSAVVIGARGWVDKDAYWITKWRLLENIKLTLDENGIEIPFPQVVVHTKEK
ncbi:MAG: mechanosensitive ion channel family protein [Tyzzerella sp.]|nr:mechanosensitive ion channel family protein [Tyzzerella sp.]